MSCFIQVNETVWKIKHLQRSSLFYNHSIILSNKFIEHLSAFYQIILKFTLNYSFIFLYLTPTLYFFVFDKWKYFVKYFKIQTMVINCWFICSQQYNESERHKMKSAEMLQIAKSSNLLLNTFEPSFLWQFLCELVKSSVSENPTARLVICEFK